MCEFRFLTKKDYPVLYRCFLDAFADYSLDLSYLTESSLKNRTIKNGIKLNRSVGMYAAGKMVGFTLLGEDMWQGVLTVFDIMTGIINEHRGKGAAQKMFDFAVPELVASGVRRFLLEVLQVNAQAVRAYSKAGFSITREFDCYELHMEDYKPQAANRAVSIEKFSREILADFADEMDFMPSWENSFAAIKRIPDEVTVYGAEANGKKAGILVYYPALNWIMTLVTKKKFRRIGIATRLLEEFVKDYKNLSSSVKLINVEHTAVSFKEYLEHRGFRVYTTQFEMAMDLS